MAAKKSTSYYVVWVGVNPGIYTTWQETQAQIKGFPNARYKKYKTREEAEDAFQGAPEYKSKKSKKEIKKIDWDEVDQSAIAVDAACSGNPGKMEYRGVQVSDSAEIFRSPAYPGGTNNIGEFLAIVHALALLDKAGDKKRVIYTDSRTAMKWVNQNFANTQLKRTRVTEPIFNLIARATKWLKTHPDRNPILKWETKSWGEIPADFGRK